MSKFKHYAEFDDLISDQIVLKTAIITQEHLLLGGISQDTGLIHFFADDAPKNIKTNKGLKEFVQKSDLNNLTQSSPGQITLAPPCRLEKLSERISEELEAGFSLGYALRISALAQYPEYQDLQDAHEIAVNIQETEKALKSKHPNNHVQYKKIPRTPDLTPELIP